MATSSPLELSGPSRAWASPAQTAAGPQTGLVVEVLDWEGARLHEEAWNALASHCLEPNPFMAPAFCLPAARYLGAYARLSFLFVWDRAPGHDGRLLSLLPLIRPRLPLWPLAKVWFHDLAALGAPLLSPDRPEAAWLAVLGWLERHQAGPAALIVRGLDRDGPTARLLHDVAVRTERGLRFFDERPRAVLEGLGAPAPSGLAALSPRRRKEILRQRRRLAERGELAYESASAPGDVRAALDRFLALEVKGWKGRAGTALVCDPSRAAFARDMVEHMAARDQCRIDTLSLDGKPIVMGIVLASANRRYFWKTAFDEDYAAASPGVQFVLDLTTRLAGTPDVAFTDSCAVPEHPMIDRLWPGRLVIADAAVGVAPGAGWRFRFIVALELFRRRGREWLKGLIIRWRQARSGGVTGGRHQRNSTER